MEHEQRQIVKISFYRKKPNFRKRKQIFLKKSRVYRITLLSFKTCFGKRKIIDSIICSNANIRKNSLKL